jgi:hypothetical protein
MLPRRAQEAFRRSGVGSTLETRLKDLRITLVCSWFAVRERALAAWPTSSMRRTHALLRQPWYAHKVAIPFRPVNSIVTR